MKMNSKYWMVLIAVCGIAASSVGVCMNTAGLFYTPMAADLGVGRGSVALMSTILSFSSSVMGMITSRIMKPKTMKPILITATVLMAGSSALFSLCPALLPIYLLCILRGFGCGLAGFITMTTLINNWFRKAHGTFTSIAMTFTGVPGLVLSPIFTSIITNSGWRTGFLAVAATIVLFNLPAILLPYTLTPADSGTVPYGQEEYEQYLRENPQHIQVGPPKHFSIYSSEFALAAIFTVMVYITAQMTQHFPSFAESKGFSAQVGALMLSVSMAGSVSCKLVYGSVADKLGNSKAMIITAFLSLISNFILLFSTASLPLQVGSFLYTVTAANSSVGVTLMAADLFGVRNYSKVYPVMTFIGTLFGAISGTMIGYLYDATGTYNIVLMTAAVMQAIAIFCVITAYKKISASAHAEA